MVLKRKKVKVSRIIAVSVGLICCLCAFSQEKSAGIFNSPKGFGITFSADTPNYGFNSFNLYADLTGVLSGKYSTPGVRFDYYRGIIIKALTTESFDCRLYAGPGVSTGFVRDYGSDNYGMLIALNGTFGAKFVFPRRIAIDLGVTADLGLHIRGEERGQTTNLKLYRNGLIRILYPQIKLEYCF